jgi:hypothetical protein
MLTEMHEWLKSQGLLFERHGQRSVPESMLTAVMGWERLRKGGDVPFPVVKLIYKYLGTEFVKHGHKGLKTADVDRMYTHESLTKDHGLLTDAIWHEALNKIGEDKRNYLIALLRRGTRITGKVPIKLSTIHGAKGGEADNVLLIGDLSTKFAQEYDKNSDDINRLLYVGITRAKQSLHLNGYPLRLSQTFPAQRRLRSTWKHVTPTWSRWGQDGPGRTGSSSATPSP